MTFKYESLREKLPVLQNILGPTAILRDFRPSIVDTDESLGGQLRSYARIIKGIIIFSSKDPRLRSMDGFTTTILGGSVKRNEKGYTSCIVNTCAPYASLQELNRQLKLDTFTIEAETKYVSTDPNAPTLFKSKRSIFIPKGTELPIMGSISQKITFDIKCDVSTSAEGFLDGHEFKGSFTGAYDYFIQYPDYNTGKCYIPFTKKGLSLKLNGNFSVELE